MNIYATPEAVEEIEKVDFVIEVLRVTRSTIDAPLYVPNEVWTAIFITSFLILVGIGFGIFYLAKKLRMSRR